MRFRALTSAAVWVLGGSMASAAIAPLPPITIGDKTFSDFTITGNVDPTTIKIVQAPGADIGLEFQHSWSSTAGAQQDTVVSYRVHVNDASQSIIAVALHFDGTANIANNNLLTAATVTESIFDANENQLGKLSVFNAGPQFIPTNRDNAVLNVAPTHDLFLQKDIMVHSGTSGTSTITLVDNTFEQSTAIPLPPAVLTGLGTLALGAMSPLRRGIRALLT